MVRKDKNIRKVDEELWLLFKAKCKKDYGKLKGHIPYPYSPRRSTMVYVIEQLLQGWIDGSIKIKNEKTRKELIMESSLKNLKQAQDSSDYNHFEDKEVKKAVIQACKEHNYYPGARTISDYIEFITLAFLTEDIDDFGYYRLETPQRTQKFKTAIHEGPELYG